MAGPDCEMIDLTRQDDHPGPVDPNIAWCTETHFPAVKSEADLLEAVGDRARDSPYRECSAPACCLRGWVSRPCPASSR